MWMVSLMTKTPHHFKIIGLQYTLLLIQYRQNIALQSGAPLGLLASAYTAWYSQHS